jgi:hypothetical protein
MNVLPVKVLLNTTKMIGMQLHTMPMFSSTTLMTLVENLKVLEFGEGVSRKCVWDHGVPE